MLLRHSTALSSIHSWIRPIMLIMLAPILEKLPQLGLVDFVDYVGFCGTSSELTGSGPIPKHLI